MLSSHPLKATPKITALRTSYGLREWLTALRQKLSGPRGFERLVGIFFNVDWEDIVWMTQTE